jgi:hypothetical protein
MTDYGGDINHEWMLTNHHSILCSDYAIKRIDEPFIAPDDDKNEWVL